MTKQPHRLRFIYKSSRSGAGGGSIIYERIPRPKVMFSQKSIVSRSSIHENSPCGTLETRVEKLCPHLTVRDSPVAQLPEQHLSPVLSSVFLITTLKPHVSFLGSSLWPLEQFPHALWEIHCPMGDTLSWREVIKAIGKVQAAMLRISWHLMTEDGSCYTLRKRLII